MQLNKENIFQFQKIKCYFQLPFEVATYWIQHTLILIVVPFFLVSLQGMCLLLPDL